MITYNVENKSMIISWDGVGIETREAVCCLCGWNRKRDNNINAMGKRIAKTAWKDLSDCARDVLEKHGIIN